MAACFLLGSSIAFAAEGEWTCPKCGAVNTTYFCTKCGCKKPDELICPGCQKAYPIDTDALYCGDCGTKLREDAVPYYRYEGPGFDTPEEAVAFFLEGLKNVDFEKMLRAFAWETQEEHYALYAYINWSKSYMPSNRPGMPILCALKSANINAMRAQQIDSIYRALEKYILRDDYPNGSRTYVPLRTEEEIDAFLQLFDNGRLEKLSGMTNIHFISPDSFTDNKYTRNSGKYMAQQLLIYGGDEIVNVVALADVGNETLFFAPTVVRYGDVWYLVSTSSFVTSMAGFSDVFVCGSL